MPLLRGTSGIATTTNASTVTLPNPSWNSGSSSTPPGDLILVYCAVGYASTNNGITFSVPGFQVIPEANGPTASAQLLYYLTNGTEGSSFTVTASAAHQFAVTARSYYNVAQAVLFDPLPAVSGVMSSTSTTAIANPGITTDYPATILAWFAMARWTSGAGAPTITAPASFVNSSAQQNSGPGTGATDASVLSAELATTSAGATGAVNGTLSTTDMNGALLIGIADISAVNAVGLYTKRRVYLPLKLRRGQSFAPMMPQANQGIPFPLVTRQSGNRPKWLPALRRGRSFAPVPPQQNQGTQFPLTVVPAGDRPKFDPRQVRRGRSFAPVPPQGNQGVQFPLVTRPSRTAQSSRMVLPRIRRGHSWEPPWTQGPVGLAWNVFTRQPGVHPRWQPSRRLLSSRIANGPIPQGNQGMSFPLVTRRQPSGMRLPPVRRGRISMVPSSIPVAQASAIITASGSVTIAAVVSKNAGAVITASGSVSISTSAVRAAAATITGHGSVRISAGISVSPAATITGRGSVRISAMAATSASVAITARGTVAITAVITRSAAATIRGAGSVSIAATTSPSLRITGTGSVSITAAPVVVPAQATIGAAGWVSVTAQSAPPEREIIIQPSWRASWDEVAESGSWQRQEPFQGPSVVETEKLREGTYEDTEPSGEI